MLHLPVIVGFGGINSAGRSSFHHGYRRMIYEELSSEIALETFTSLATMMGLLKYENGRFFNQLGIECSKGEIVEKYQSQIIQNTLIRRLNSELFNPDEVLFHKKIHLHSTNGDRLTFKVLKKDLPEKVPTTWKIEPNFDINYVNISLPEGMEVLFKDHKPLLMQSAGQLPTGFNPGSYYKSTNHPRALQMTVYGVSDALHSLGFEWETVQKYVSPDQIGVYAGSGLGQQDEYGSGGYLRAFLLGKRVSSKQMPLSLVHMHADFINAYILGNLGHTACSVGACASFLYNLYAAITDIQTGKRRIAIVGNSEATLLPEIIESYRVMNALADDKKLLQLGSHKNQSTPDYKKSCRPFADNCGFVPAESAQYLVLFDDTLALEMGTQVHGSIGNVSIHADGFKKSITQPGIGNYLTLAKTLSIGRAILGEKSLQQNTFVHAHATGTPQNRVTESHCLEKVAKAFGITKWPIAAIKSYVGHSTSPAAGDQIMAALGTWKYNIIPGIPTLDKVAEDVYNQHLLISKEHTQIDDRDIEACLINSKGFGGNNGTSLLLSPQKTKELMKQRHGQQALTLHKAKSESTEQIASEKDQEITSGNFKPIYHYGRDVLSSDEIILDNQAISIPGYSIPLSLKTENPYL